jgi:gamma-glutamyl hercynylcysteine S-oxide synthase
MTTRTHSYNNARNWSLWLSAAVAATVFVCGLLWQSVSLLGGGAAVLCIVLRQFGAATSIQEPRRRGERVDPRFTNEDQSRTEQPRVLDQLQAGTSPHSTDALVDELLATRRYALLLRPETKQHLSQLHIVRAIRQLDESMALVPAGRVLLGQLAEQSHSACGPTDTDPKLIERNLVSVEPTYLDRFCVTNEEYQRFVDAGGYEQLEFWHEEALPALLDFVDQTGAPGPHYWSDGQYPGTEGRLPVVGISWYEAWAYARWVGKRLPTDAEWTKAGAWPVESAPGRIAQRRYPWGESFDVRRAHLYGSGQNGPVPVEEYPGGTSVGGIHQLIGNVWEWTSTPLNELSDSTLHVSEAVMSVRGGAYDTYFENQATCHFQSGEQSLSRRRNIGFRLALPMSHLEPNNDNDQSSPTENTAPQSNLEREPALAAL